MILLREGKNKEVAGTTYKALLSTVEEIANCPYPERKPTVPEEEEEEEEVEEEQEPHPIVEPVSRDNKNSLLSFGCRCLQYYPHVIECMCEHLQGIVKYFSVKGQRGKVKQ